MIDECELIGLWQAEATSWLIAAKRFRGRGTDTIQLPKIDTNKISVIAAHAWVFSVTGKWAQTYKRTTRNSRPDYFTDMASKGGSRAEIHTSPINMPSYAIKKGRILNL